MREIGGGKVITRQASDWKYCYSAFNFDSAMFHCQVYFVRIACHLKRLSSFAYEACKHQKVRVSFIKEFEKDLGLVNPAPQYLSRPSISTRPIIHSNY